MPLGHLIALIINAHSARQRSRSSVHANGSIGRTLNRKTSLLRTVPTACGQAAGESIDDNLVASATFVRRATQLFPCSEICASIVTCVTVDSRSDPTSSRCQKSQVRHTRATAPAGQGRSRATARIRFHGRACSRDFAVNNLQSAGWWSQSGSNRRPHACKARALPTELRPQFDLLSCRPQPVYQAKPGGPGTS